MQICSCLPVSLVFIFTGSVCVCVWMMKHHRCLHQVTTPRPALSPGSSTTWPCIRIIRIAAELKSDQCCGTETTRTSAGQRNSFQMNCQSNRNLPAHTFKETVSETERIFILTVVWYIVVTLIQWVACYKGLSLGRLKIKKTQPSI